MLQNLADMIQIKCQASLKYIHLSSISSANAILSTPQPMPNPNADIIHPVQPNPKICPALALSRTKLKSSHQTRSVALLSTIGQTSFLPSDWSIERDPKSDKMIHPLSHEPCHQDKQGEECAHRVEPGQIILVTLTRNPYIHAVKLLAQSASQREAEDRKNVPPHSGDDIQRQYHRTQHGKLPEHVAGLLGALVHGNVELGEVVGVGTRENAVCWVSFRVSLSSDTTITNGKSYFS